MGSDPHFKGSAGVATITSSMRQGSGKALVPKDSMMHSVVNHIVFNKELEVSGEIHFDQQFGGYAGLIKQFSLQDDERIPSGKRILANYTSTNSHVFDD